MLWNRLKGLTNKKYFHVIVLSIILLLIIFIAGLIILKYNVEGETNMPFRLTKIAIISSSGGINKETADSRWNFDICQYNDIYLYVEKNTNYDEVEAIKRISIENINVEAKNNDNIVLYRPKDSIEGKFVYENTENYIIGDNLQYDGDIQSNVANMKISNQGGMIAFRCANNNVGEYKSDEEQIEHEQLLKKAGVAEEDLYVKLNFDVIIGLENLKEYKANIDLELPVEGVVEEGITSLEINDLSKFIFKRISR